MRSSVSLERSGCKPRERGSDKRGNENRLYSSLLSSPLLSSPLLCIAIDLSTHRDIVLTRPTGQSRLLGPRRRLQPTWRAWQAQSSASSSGLVRGLSASLPPSVRSRSPSSWTTRTRTSALGQGGAETRRVSMSVAFAALSSSVAAARRSSEACATLQALTLREAIAELMVQSGGRTAAGDTTSALSPVAVSLERSASANPYTATEIGYSQEHHSCAPVAALLSARVRQATRAREIFRISSSRLLRCACSLLRPLRTRSCSSPVTEMAVAR